jgi:outer membrane protein assembly factor BamB
MRSRRQFLAVASATLGATALAGCGALRQDDGDAGDGSAPVGTAASNVQGPGPEYGGVVEDREPVSSPPGGPPSGAAVAWSVPVGVPVTARPVVVGDVVVLGAGEHEARTRPARDAELRPRYPGYVHAVGVDGERRFRYEAPAPVLDLAPVAGDDASGRGARRAGVYALLGWYGGPGGVAHRLARVVDGRPRWVGPAQDRNRFVAASTRTAVVTGTRDERVALTGERLTARSPSGAWRWQVESGDVLAGVGHGGRAYLAVGTRETRCLDVASGRTVWSFEGTPPTWTPRVQGDVVFVARTRRTGLGGQPLVALDAATGARRWTFAGDGEESFTPVAAVRDDAARTADAVVYVAGGDGDIRAVVGGEARWRRSLSGRVVDGPAVGGGRVYATDTRGVLHAIDAASGERAWRVPLDLPSRALGTTADDVVAIAASDGASDGDSYRVRAYDHDGRQRFGHDGAEGLLAARTHQGRAYAVTDGGHLAAFDD